MTDISLELEIIATESSGIAVCDAVAQALDTINKEVYSMVDINQELVIIRTGIYGKDIRQAIYDALHKLANAEPSSEAVGSLTIGAMENPKPVIHSKEASMFWIEQTNTKE